MNMIFSVMILMIYTIISGWIAAYFIMDKNNTNSFFPSLKKSSPISVSLSGISSEFSFWIIILPIMSSNINYGIRYTYYAAIGLAIGFIMSWIILSQRIRIYGDMSNSTSTIPSFISSRFKDNSGLSNYGFGIICFIYGILYASAALAIAATLVKWMFGVNFIISLLMCLLLTGSYIAITNRSPNSSIGISKGVIIILSLITIVILCYYNITTSSDTGMFYSSQNVLDNLILKNRYKTSYQGIISALGWGLCFLGSPSLIYKFISLKGRRNSDSARILSSLIAILSIMCCVFIGTVLASKGELDENRAIYARLYQILKYPIIQAIISVSASTLLMYISATYISISSKIFCINLYPAIRKNKAEENTKRTLQTIFVIITFITTCISYFVAYDALNITLYSLACLTASLCPTFIFCLHSSKITNIAAVSSAISGIFTATLFNYFLAPEIGGIFNINPILPATLISTLTLLIVSSFTKNTNQQQIQKEYHRMIDILKCRGHFIIK